MVLKSALGRALLRAVSRVDGLVLQGGGAVHHVYGSPRFSADLDFAQSPSLSQEALNEALEAVRREAHDAWGRAELTQSMSRGRLHRQKIRVPLRPGTTIVLAVERYETPVHRPERRPLEVDPSGITVAVESPAELIADKIAASIDRLRTRGTIKLRDLYDLDVLRPLEAPDAALVLQKLMDYGLPVDLTPVDGLVATLDAFAEEELVEQLRGVLPASDLAALDARALLSRVRAMLSEVRS